MKRISRICGVGLVVVMLVSLLSFAAPAAAGTLSWTAETIPSSTNKVVVATTDVSDFAVGADGTTVWATDDQGAILYKSTNGGVGWSQVTNPTGLTTPRLVAIAPDDNNYVVVAGDTDNLEVYVSTNGGSTWGALPTIVETGLGAASVITDLAIAPLYSGTHYVAVSGYEAGPLANIWYFNVGSAAPVWKETNSLAGFSITTANSTAAAIAFSPNFPSDLVMAAVTEDDDGAGAADYISVELFSFSTLKWNVSAGFSSYPARVTTTADLGITDLTAASIGLAPDYLGSDDSMRVSFVGLTVAGDADAVTLSGIYRFKDYSKAALKTGAAVYSVSFDGTNLVAGAQDTTAVYYSSDPLATSPTVLTTSSLKRPGGQTKTIVKFAGGSVFAGTTGIASAFAISRDNGKNYNDLSLIDTALSVLNDVAVSADGGKTYLVSDNGTDLSLWRYAGSWERVLNLQAQTAYIVRTSPDNSDVVYIAKKGAQDVYYTKDGGVTKWFTRTARYVVADLAVESTDVSYIAVSGAKTVSKSTNGGFTWGTAKATEVVSGNLATITVLSKDNVIVGSAEGYVSYSTDGNSNWTKISKQIETSGLLTQVTASGLATGNFIYAATSKATGAVLRWEVGQAATTPWKDLLAPVSTGYMGTGIALQGGVLYVATQNGTDSAVLRTLSPSISEPAATYWSTLASTGEKFDAAPSALRVSATTSLAKLWAADSAADALFSFSDTLAIIGPTQSVPGDKLKITVNPVSGRGYDIVFTWARPSEATKYDVWIAYDSAFTQTVLKVSGISSTSSTPSQVIGPTGPTGAVIEFMPGTAYYWRVRASSDGPIFSQWSAVRSFTIEPLAQAVPAILSPLNGATGTSRTPSFSWSPTGGATDYRFVMADNVALANPIVDVKISTTGYAKFVELDYGKTYYWAVKVAAPIEGGWSAVSNFTVMEQPKAPTPPVVITQVPAPVISIPPAPQPTQIVIPPAPAPPAPITPAYIWAIIIIGAILVIAVIVLIVRTRRAV